MFPEEQEKTLEKSLQRLVCDGLLQRVAKGVYVNTMLAGTERRCVAFQNVNPFPCRPCYTLSPKGDGNAFQFNQPLSRLYPSIAGRRFALATHRKYTRH